MRPARKDPKLIDEILLSNKTDRQIAIDNKATQSYVFQLRQNIQKLHFPPKIVDGKVVCFECGNREPFVIHHHHPTGIRISLICQGCNHSLEEIPTRIDSVDFNKIDLETDPYRHPKYYEKWKTVPMSMDTDFPLTGSETKEVLTNWKPIFLAVAQGPDAWADFKKHYGKLAEKCDKLLKWSDQNGKSI